MTMHDEYLSEGILWLNLLNLAGCSIVRNRLLTCSLNLFIAGSYAFASVVPMSLVSPPSLPLCIHIHTFGLDYTFCLLFALPKQPFALSLLIDQVFGIFLKAIDWIFLSCAK